MFRSSPFTRRRATRVAAVAALATAGVLGVAGPATAATTPDSNNVRFVMHEKVDHTTESYTFTSTAPLCPAGRFADHVTVVNGNAKDTVFVWQVDTTYTCVDGSGTFTATKHLVRRVDDQGAQNWGVVEFTGGTGAFASLRGHGIDIGASANQHGAGSIVGHLMLGS